MAAMPTNAPPVPRGGRPSGFGDGFAKLLLVVPTPNHEPRLLRALHLEGVAATPTGRDGDGQRLFGARIVADPADEWAELRPWVRAIVAFGADAWAATLDALDVGDPGFTTGASVSVDRGRAVTVLGSLPLDDPALPDAALAEVLSAAQQAAGLTWGCGGKP